MDSSPLGRLVRGIAGALAIAGGAVLTVVTIVTVLSIAGRILIPFGLRPIPGDFEIVQAGMVFAIFAFLPWAHLTRGNAIVAILTDRFAVRINALFEFAADLVMLVVALFIAWRLGVGLGDKFANREQTFILRYPVWWAYAAGMLGASVFALASAYCALRSGRNALSRAPERPTSETSE